VSFAARILCVASQRVFIVVSFVIHSVRKLLDTPSYSIWVLLWKKQWLRCLSAVGWSTLCLVRRVHAEHGPV